MFLFGNFCDKTSLVGKNQRFLFFLLAFSQGILTDFLFLHLQFDFIEDYSAFF